MHLKFRTLEVFQLFSQTENVSETARVLRVSQPAVSQALREMEAQVGLPLFSRIGRKLSLTPEARLLLPQIERLLSQMLSVGHQVQNIRNGNVGSLSVTCIATLAHSVLPAAIADLRKQRPGIQLQIGSHTAAQISEQIRLERADIGITFLPVNTSGIHIEPLIKTAFTCLVPRGSPLAKEPHITMDQLRDQCVIAQGPGTVPGFLLHHYFKQEDMLAVDTIEVNRSTVSYHLVEQGIGVAFSHPLAIAMGNTNRVVAIPFKPEIELTVALAYLAERIASPHIKTFADIIRHRMTRISKELADAGLFCEML